MGETISNKALGQRKRAQTPEGRRHLEKMSEASARAKRAKRKVPEEFKHWNVRMRRAGIPQAERFAAIRDAAIEAQARPVNVPPTVEPAKETAELGRVA